MGSPVVPPVIPQPFANNNPSLRNVIPNTTTTTGAASWDQGFPASTMQPVVAGGVPPFGQDMNGVEFALSSNDYYMQAGELFPYQSAVATAIGGYGVGALLGSATDPDVVWFNTVGNNTTNPDATDGSAAGWVSLFAYGFATLNTLTGASPVTLTNLEASRKFIVLNGTLTATLNIFLPAAILKDWLIINNTSGSFTTNLRTTAGGSIGVLVPQGGWSNPLGVYSDGTNVYPSVAPLGIPISQGATPLTLAERDNNANLTAQYFLGLSGYESLGSQPFNGFIGLGPDTNTFRKYRTTDIESILSLSAIGGQVTAGQVPLSAVIQYVTNILANAALTGTPTAPTPAPGTANTQVATTAFVTGTNSFTGTAMYFTLPNGAVVQCGLVTSTGGNGSVSFGTTPGTIRFPNTLVAPLVINFAGGAVQTWIGGKTSQSFSFSTTNSSSGATNFWIAIGY